MMTRVVTEPIGLAVVTVLFLVLSRLLIAFTLELII